MRRIMLNVGCLFRRLIPKRHLLVALGTSLITIGVQVQAGEPLRDQYEVSFRGQRLQGILQPLTTITCTSKITATTGYYPKEGFVGGDLVSALEKQSRVQRWEISLQDKEAFDRAASQRYTVLRRDGFGVTLVGVEAGATGITVEVITIDPSTGSFVSSRSGVSVLWNRTNVYVGRCN